MGVARGRDQRPGGRPKPPRKSAPFPSEPRAWDRGVERRALPPPSRATHEPRPGGCPVNVPARGGGPTAWGSPASAVGAGLGLGLTPAPAPAPDVLAVRSLGFRGSPGSGEPQTAGRLARCAAGGRPRRDGRRQGCGSRRDPEAGSEGAPDGSGCGGGGLKRRLGAQSRRRGGRIGTLPSPRNSPVGRLGLTQPRPLPTFSGEGAAFTSSSRELCPRPAVQGFMPL